MARRSKGTRAPRRRSAFNRERLNVKVSVSCDRLGSDDIVTCLARACFGGGPRYLRKRNQGCGVGESVNRADAVALALHDFASVTQKRLTRSRSRRERYAYNRGEEDYYETT